MMKNLWIQTVGGGNPDGWSYNELAGKMNEAAEKLWGMNRYRMCTGSSPRAICSVVLLQLLVGRSTARRLRLRDWKARCMIE